MVVEGCRADILDAHMGRAVLLVAQNLGGALGEIDDAGSDERPAIVDADHDLEAIVEIGDLNIARQRQCRMGRGELSHVEPLTIRSPPPVEGLAVPGCGSLLVVT